MKRALLWLVAAGLLGAAAFMLAGVGSKQPGGDAAMEFAVVEVRVDPLGRSLAAYQVEVRLKGARLVGVEGGSSSAYASPPRYDPRALHGEGGERVIIAAIAEGAGPSGDSVVAVLHFAMPASSDAEPVCTLMAVGDPDADRIEATCRATLMRAPAREGVEP